METVEVLNATKSIVVATQAELAVSLGQRMKGLIGRSSLPFNEALILKPCSSIHTFFMRFAIDVLFLNKEMRIIRMLQNMPPNRLGPIVWTSIMAIELSAGKIGQTNTQPGDLIELR
ncbi:MAG: DUF192 domain-containing protein [Candidatus Omnitrophota bacterium]|nr:MAG: DUF192 domain-containing protein [Candidatus Omnitrophota bacterium]